MPNALLEARQHRLLIASIDVDDPIRTEAHLSQSRCKQILPGDAPEHLPPGARRNAGREQCSSRPVDGGVPSAGDFV